MGEEVKPDDDVVAEWETGLPTADDLMPLSQSLIPSELASAFKISPEPPRTAVDVNRASQTTLSSLRSSPFADPDEAEGSEPDPDSKRTRRSSDEVKKFATADEDHQSTAAKTNQKRPRLVWTPQLHKRFIEVVAHLGLDNAVPKTIMQLMNVEGLTRENVASHLQKYRLYMKRNQGGGSSSNEGPLTLDHHLFVESSSNTNNNNNGNNNNNNISSGNGSNGNNHHHTHGHGRMGMQFALPYHHHHHPQMMPMPMMMSSNGHGFHNFNHQPQYSGMVQQQSDWSGSSNKTNNNKYNGYFHHAVQNNQ